VVKKRPHTVVFSWTSEGTYNTLREYVDGTETSVSVACDIQPNTAKYTVGTSGDVQQASYRIFADRFDNDTNVPETGVTANFFDLDHVVLKFFIYQKHLEVFV
jgi:hypothetical protein